MQNIFFYGILYIEVIKSRVEREGGSMGIYPLDASDYRDVVALWNKNVFNKEMLYKQQAYEVFVSNFFVDQEDIKKITYIYKQAGKTIGFINGCYKPSKATVYITYLLVDAHYRRKGIGDMLFRAFEKHVVSMGDMYRIEISYKNPVKLEWTIPYTQGHVHPHAPGIDMGSEAYLFFKNRGYQDRTTQHAYYRTLKDITGSNQIKEKIEAFKQQGYQINYYKPTQHKELDKLFKDLGSSKWQQSVEEQLQQEDGAPMLVVEDAGGKICGFTGPLLVAENKRGYFSGIGVQSKYRSCGIGKVLFEAMCMGLEMQGAEYMTMFADEESGVRHIYEDAGFRIVRSWKTLYHKLDVN